MSKSDFINRDDQEWVELAQKWTALHQQMALLQEETQSLREKLISLAENKNVQGGGIRLKRSLRKGAIQYDRIPELQDVDLERYRKESIEIWTLTSCNKEERILA